MQFTFDIQKTLAAVGYLLGRAGGSWNLLKTVKAVYAADKVALMTWQRTITGDRLCSMDNGPVPSITYNLIKGEAPPRHQRVWDQYFAKRSGNAVKLVKGPNQDVLSERELRVLCAVFNKIAPMGTRELLKWMHQQPEWEDPHGSSKTIDPATILARNTLLTKEEIAVIEDEVSALAYANTVFG